MRLTGAHTYQASPPEIWQLLMDADTLAQITPGISRLEKTEENKYKAFSDISMGPVKGSFEGDLEVADPQEPDHFTLKVNQRSKIGNAKAEIKIQLQETGEGQTRLEFSGQAKLSGMLARIGQRLVSGVANTLSKQFFKALEDELAQAKNS